MCSALCNTRAQRTGEGTGHEPSELWAPALPFALSQTSGWPITPVSPGHSAGSSTLLRIRGKVGGVMQPAGHNSRECDSKPLRLNTVALRQRISILPSFSPINSAGGRGRLRSVIKGLWVAGEQGWCDYMYCSEEFSAFALHFNSENLMKAMYLFPKRSHRENAGICALTGALRPKPWPSLKFTLPSVRTSDSQKR